MRYKKCLPTLNSTRHAGDVVRAWGSVQSVMRLAVVSVMLLGLMLVVPDATRASDSEPGNLKLIELYTSHGCSSCPAADKLLGELIAADDQLMALEFHVDYWNTLVHGSDGNFVDPFSKPEFSLRQREYNAASLAGRPGVYTPQAVVNGRFAAVGSNRRHITKALDREVVQTLMIGVSADNDPDRLLVTVTGSSEQIGSLAGTDIKVAHFISKAVTDITGGENSRKTVTNHNIVTSMTTLGEVSGEAGMTFSIVRPAGNEGCVIMVQEDALTPVFAAVACPQS